MADRGKYQAYAALLDRIRSINGSAGGFHTDLGGRVYEKLILPGIDVEVKMPYACVPMVDDEDIIRTEGQLVEVRWPATVYLFVAEQDTSGLNPTAPKQCADLRDDVLKALLGDWTLGGKAQDVKLATIRTLAGADDADYGEVQFPLIVHQIFGRDDLGPT